MRRGHSIARAGRREDPTHPLDGHELRILELWSRGASTTEVAGRLDLPEQEVHESTPRILDKLGVHSRVEAVAYAIASGLLGSR